MNVKGKLKFTGPNIQSTELGGVTLWDLVESISDCNFYVDCHLYLFELWSSDRVLCRVTLHYTSIGFYHVTICFMAYVVIIIEFCYLMIIDDIQIFLVK